MIKTVEILRQLSANAEVFRALVYTISGEQEEWKPNSETWCMKEVMEHVYNEEIIDFRNHLREMFSNPPLSWGAFHHDEFISVESCRQALEGFLKEREASIAWLKSLSLPDWDIASQATFGPGGDVLVLKAGDVLVSWVAHDYLHIRQINELFFAWNETQVSSYSVQYAGGW